MQPTGSQQFGRLDDERRNLGRVLRIAQEEPAHRDPFEDQRDGADRDGRLAQRGISDERAVAAEQIDQGRSGRAAAPRASFAKFKPSGVSTITRSPPSAFSSSISSVRRTRLIVLKPRALAKAMTARPTPELAAFWTTQSPAARSTNSLNNNPAVGGLMVSMASCCGSTLVGSANSPSAGTTMRSAHERP